MKQLRIGYLSTMYHTSHILQCGGAVERELKAAPQWHLFGTGPAMIEAFGSGGLDLGYIGLPPAMIGIGGGLKLKCIAGGHVEGTVLVGPAGAGVARDAAGVGGVLARFAGKKIGAPARGSIHDIILRHLLGEHAVAGADVVNYAWADLMPQAIADGEIAAAAGTPPLAEVARTWHGLDIIVPPRLLWPFNPSYGIVVREALLRERALLESFIALHEQASNLIRERPAEAAAMVAGRVQAVDAAFVGRVFAVSPHYCAALPGLYRRSAMAFAPVLRALGSVDHRLSEDEVFDLSFIDRVHPEAHHY